MSFAKIMRIFDFIYILHKLKPSNLTFLGGFQQSMRPKTIRLNYYLFVIIKQTWFELTNWKCGVYFILSKRGWIYI